MVSLALRGGKSHLHNSHSYSHFLNRFHTGRHTRYHCEPPAFRLFYATNPDHVLVPQVQRGFSDPIRKNLAQSKYGAAQYVRHSHTGIRQPFWPQILYKLTCRYHMPGKFYCNLFYSALLFSLYRRSPTRVFAPTSIFTLKTPVRWSASTGMQDTGMRWRTHAL